LLERVSSIKALDIHAIGKFICIFAMSIYLLVYIKTRMLGEVL
jgi:hypothetical protein